jgi:hypothetical protein
MTFGSNYQQYTEKTHALKSLVIIFCSFQKFISPPFWTDRFLVFSHERDPPRARKCFGATDYAVALQKCFGATAYAVALQQDPRLYHF